MTKLDATTRRRKRVQRRRLQAAAERLSKEAQGKARK